MTDIVDDIKSFILDNNITQAELSDEIGYSYAYLNRVLNRKVDINSKFEYAIKQYIERFKLKNQSENEEMSYENSDDMLTLDRLKELYEISKQKNALYEKEIRILNEMLKKKRTIE